jgi:hypothetical protein
MDPGWRAALARESHPVRLRAIKHAEQDATLACPVDTGDLKSTITGEADQTTMDCRLSSGGPTDGGGWVDYAAAVEDGSRPHKITSHGPWPLRNRETGEVFGQSVDHPGTKAQPYLRPGVMSIGGFKG